MTDKSNLADSTLYLGDSTAIVEFSSAKGGFSSAKGSKPTGLFSRTELTKLAEKSNTAVDKAMNTIRMMSERVNSTMQNMDQGPAHVELEYGIKFDADIGVIISKSKTESSMTVKIVWDKPSE